MRLSLRTRIAAPVLLTAAIVLAAGILFTYRQRVADLDRADLKTLEGRASLVNGALDANFRRSVALATWVANDPEIVEAFAARDRERLAKLTLPVYQASKKPLELAQFQFHLPPATSFYRVHKPAKFGDDLSGFRKTVVKANQEKAVVRGLEVGVAGAGCRAVVPVSQGGRHLGTVEFGLALNDKFVKAIKSSYGFDFSVAAKGGDQSWRFWARTADQELTPELVPELQAVLASGEPAISHLERGGRDHAFYFSPLRDFSGHTVAVMINDLDRSASLAEAASQAWTLGLAGCAALVLLGLVVLLNARRISRSLTELGRRLGRTSEQVAAAAAEIASSADTLAQGATRQSAALEETVHAHQGIAGQVRSSSEHASTAAAAMGENSKVVEAAEQSMKEMNQAMDEIHQASGQIEGIIRTINDIAFQTNLLALNAAVEAARAGEAGAGFAVVADEVRNLAMRAGEAAGNTQALIETTVSRVQTGNQVLQRTNEQFSQVSRNNEQVAGLVDQMAELSKQQGEGVERIGQEISQLESVAQQVAAGAEEGAASGEDLASRSLDLQGVVTELTGLVEGRQRENSSRPEPERRLLPGRK